MRNFFYVLMLVISVLSCIQANAQNYAVYNSYCINPYLYNPAEVATDYTYLFVNHRQQWVGIDGAPVLSTVSINTMINETHSGIGAKASSFKRGLLTTTDAALTYAYGIPFSQKTVMFFGLSAGAITNNIDLSKVDLSDPAFANYQANNIQPAANFGLLLRSASGFNFGVALPQLFGPKFNNATSFESFSVSPLDNIVISTYYRKKIEGSLTSKNRKGVKSKVKTNDRNAPIELYAMYKYAKVGDGQLEFMGKLNLSENFWLGATYRLSYGFAGSLGFSLNRFLLSYSYEPGNQPVPAFASKGSHEMQLGLRLGDVKKYKRVAPVIRSTLKTAALQHSARFQHTEEDPDNIRNEQKIKKKYYVVIKVFGDFVSADAFKKKLVGDKYNANVFYYEKEKKYYVYVYETFKQSEAHEEVRNLKTYTKLKEARLLTVTIEETP